MNILFVTLDQFPSGDAGSLRELSFCNILKELGHEVQVISQAVTRPYSIHSFRGIEFVSLRSSSSNYLSRVMNYLDHRRRLKMILVKLIENKKIDVIWMTTLPIDSLFFLKRFAKRNSIKLIYDSVEWFSPQNFKWGRLCIFFWINEFWNRWLITKDFSVVAISYFLFNHFMEKGIFSVRIPVILDTYEIKPEKNTVGNQLVLVYAGSPAKKDYLIEVIAGMSLLSKEELSFVQLKILGVTWEQLTRQFGVNSEHLLKCSNSVQTYGRVSREEVLSHLKTADFTVLLRPPKLRYAKAGFPTKVAESLASATPVICNLTSDLNLYLKDFENCILIEECTPEAFAQALRKALKLTKKEKEIMYLGSRKTAEKYFDFRQYHDVINSFLIGKLHA